MSTVTEHSFVLPSYRVPIEGPTMTSDDRPSTRTRHFLNLNTWVGRNYSSLSLSFLIYYMTVLTRKYIFLGIIYIFKEKEKKKEIGSDIFIKF